MNTSNLSAYPGYIYRIDRFKVPQAGREEFLQRVHGINQFLRTLPGFVHDLVLEQTGGPGTFNLITIVAWASPEAMASARQKAEERYKETGFKPGEFMQKLGIEADLATYQTVNP